MGGGVGGLRLQILWVQNQPTVVGLVCVAIGASGAGCRACMWCGHKHSTDLPSCAVTPPCPPCLQVVKTHNPSLHASLVPYMGKTLDDNMAAYVRAVLEVAARAYVPAAPCPVGVGGADGPAVAPLSWKEEEAYVRTGVFVGQGLGVRPGGGAAEVDGHVAWAPSSLGGSDVKRALRPYAMDGTGVKEALSSCTKHKEANQSLLPGCLFGWCLECGICNSFAVMPSCETPRTVFELLFTRWQTAPEVLCYDNGCNAMHFCLNRECQHFQGTSFYVDAMHYRDHVRCAADFNSATYDGITNSSLAEQKNSILRMLEHNCGYMSQITFLIYIRYFLHRMNQIQRQRNAGTCWHAQSASKW